MRIWRRSLSKLLVSTVYSLGCVALYLSVLGCAKNNNYIRKTTEPADGVVATDGVLIRAEAEPAFVFQSGARFIAPFHSDCPDRIDVSKWMEAEQRGARRVVITHPGLAAPLYGVLALCRIAPSYAGPASRSYRIEVPQSYVDATDGGLMSVVYEPYAVGNQQFPAWALWLSRQTLPPQAPQGNSGALKGR